MKGKIRKNIHIEILKYAHEHGEFTCRKLSDDLYFNENEKNQFFGKLMHEKALIQNTGRNKKTGIGEESIFTISTEGRFKLLEFEQLDNAHKESQKAFRLTLGALIISIFSLGVSVFTSCQTQQSLKLGKSSLEKNQQSIELSTDPEILISTANADADNDRLQFPGHSQILNSKANFILKNGFLGDLKDVDIKMIILEMHADEKTKHPTICPFAYVDYTNNPNFRVGENLRTYSILNNRLYNLKSLEEIYFSIDYNNLNPIIQNKSDTNFFIKIDVYYKRKIDNKPFVLTKIYKIQNWSKPLKDDKHLKTEYLVDTDIDKQIIAFNDLNNQILNKTDFKFPFFAVYPFKESSFVKIIKSNFIPPYSLEQSECEYFELNSKIKIIE